MKVWVKTNAPPRLRMKMVPLTSSQADRRKRKTCSSPPPSLLVNSYHNAGPHHPWHDAKKTTTRSKHLRRLAESPLTQPLSQKFKLRQKRLEAKLNQASERVVQMSLAQPLCPKKNHDHEPARSRPQSSKSRSHSNTSSRPGFVKKLTVKIIKSMAQNLVHEACDDAILQTLPFLQRDPLMMPLSPEPQVDSADEEYSTDDEACS